MKAALIAIRWDQMAPPVRASVLHACMQSTGYRKANTLLRIFNLGNPRVLLKDDGVTMAYAGIHNDDKPTMELLFRSYL